jgi:hypothetical protein
MRLEIRIGKMIILELGQEVTYNFNILLNNCGIVAAFFMILFTFKVIFTDNYLFELIMK